MAAAEHADATVPVAVPVRLQGIATIIILAVLLALLCGGGYVVLSKVKPGGGGGGGNGDGNGNGGSTGNGARTNPINKVEPFNPFKGTGIIGGGPGVDEMAIDSPIVYCIEGGSSMADTLNYAVAMTLVSIRGLSADHRFNVLIGEEGGDDADSWYRFLLKDYTGGGPAGEQTVGKLLDEVTGTGAPNVSRLLKAALARKPHTIVFFASKPVYDAEELGKLAKAQGVRIVAICLTDDPEIAGHMAKLAETSGGASRAHSPRELDGWASTADFN